jgi:hypothetical protein
MSKIQKKILKLTTGKKYTISERANVKVRTYSNRKLWKPKDENIFKVQKITAKLELYTQQKYPSHR